MPPESTTPPNRTTRNKIPLLTLALALATTLGYWQSSSSKAIRHAHDLFAETRNAELQDARREFERTLNLTYDALRTMAMLPGVIKIDRYAKDFEGDPKTSVQQLYNNIASHVAVSEIYIVPADIECSRESYDAGDLAAGIGVERGEPDAGAVGRGTGE